MNAFRGAFPLTKFSIFATKKSIRELEIGESNKEKIYS